MQRSIKRHYLGLILDGHKAVECRLTRIPCPPYGMIRSGEKLLLKESGGPIRGEAVVEDVIFLDNLTPECVKGICQKYNHQVLADHDYWHSHEDCRYCSLIWLENVKKCTPWRIRTTGMRAWITCDQHHIRKLTNKAAR